MPLQANARLGSSYGQSGPVSGPSYGAGSAGRPAQVWQRYRRHRLAMMGLCIWLVLAAAALLAPWAAPYAYDEVDTSRRLQPPGREHLLGTDQVGRDILSRMLYGGRVSLGVGFAAVGLAAAIGVLVGSAAGYFGGVIDDILMRVTELVLAFPTFFLLVTVAVLVEGRLISIMMVIGFTTWPVMARLVRGQFLSLSTREFVEAARASGASHGRLIFRHLLPNALSPIIVAVTLGLGAAILAESALAFLGLGVQEPYPSWGSLLHGGQRFIRQAPWYSLFPGTMIFLTVLAANAVGDGLRDALDPRMKE